MCWVEFLFSVHFRFKALPMFNKECPTDSFFIASKTISYDRAKYNPEPKPKPNREKHNRIRCWNASNLCCYLLWSRSYTQIDIKFYNQMTIYNSSSVLTIVCLMIIIITYEMEIIFNVKRSYVGSHWFLTRVRLKMRTTMES